MQVAGRDHARGYAIAMPMERQEFAFCFAVRNGEDIGVGDGLDAIAIPDMLGLLLVETDDLASSEPQRPMQRDRVHGIERNRIVRIDAKAGSRSLQDEATLRNTSKGLLQGILVPAPRLSWGSAEQAYSSASGSKMATRATSNLQGSSISPAR